MAAFSDRLIWQKREPISLYKKVMDAFHGDPDPLLAKADSPDEEVREEGLKELGDLLAPVFEVERGDDAIRLYKAFMDYVDRTTQEYEPLADINYQPQDWFDVTGLWFNRRRPAYRQMWATYRAVRAALDNTALPDEAYQAMAGSEAEAMEMSYVAETDLQDRAIVAKAR